MFRGAVTHLAFERNFRGIVLLVAHCIFLLRAPRETVWAWALIVSSGFGRARFEYLSPVPTVLRNRRGGNPQASLKRRFSVAKIHLI